MTDKMNINSIATVKGLRNTQNNNRVKQPLSGSVVNSLSAASPYNCAKKLQHAGLLVPQHKNVNFGALTYQLAALKGLVKWFHFQKIIIALPKLFIP